MRPLRPRDALRAQYCPPARGGRGAHEGPGAYLLRGLCPLPGLPACGATEPCSRRCEPPDSGGNHQEVSVPGQYVPRTPYADECHYRVYQPRPTALRRCPAGASAGQSHQGSPERPSPLEPDQRHPGPVQDRGRTDGGEAEQVQSQKAADDLL